MQNLINDYYNAFGIDKVFFLTRINNYVSNKELKVKEKKIYNDFLLTI